jgi:hypothetical protein
VAFKQSGESLFDSLFEFDRQLKETLRYANSQKNGSLDERLIIGVLDQESTLPLNSAKEEIANKQDVNIENHDNNLIGSIHFIITDDVDDEALYGRNRHQDKPRGR